ncbi:MAG TPA: alpha/beta fold hydrolase [Candidatus Acidoferrales bacterium]|nr:alpha/beta fold hydrolase [Candidatus Acidoferrales bacterium]
MSVTAPGAFGPEPSRIVASPDGVPIALFEAGLAPYATDRPSLLLVHGTTADHTTFRALAPVLGLERHLVAIDRRGRGASGDALGEPPYSIEREYDDLAAVAHTVATLEGRPVDVLGHSYGGRVALGASLRSEWIRRIVVYEGAPSAPGSPYRPGGIEARVRSRLEAGDDDGALETFFREIVGMDDAAIEAYRANPVWPLRAAAAGTILRELVAEASPPASLDALGDVPVPVLLVLGSASREPFATATAALAARLSNASVVTIDGAAHAAHHTHVVELATAVERFLDA